MKKLVLIGAVLTAAHCSTAYAGNSENGKKLFASPSLGGGTNGKSCASCHADGAKLNADLFSRDRHVIMGKKMGSVADIVNICIEKAMAGKAIHPEGEEMADILAYMQELVKEKKQ